MDDSVITCDEIIYGEGTNSNEKYITCKTQNFYILLAIALLIGVNVHCYLIIY